MMKNILMGGSNPKKNINDQYPAFTNFTIKVHVNNSWHDTVKTVLKSVQGVTTFRMEDDGKVNISGYIDPCQLLSCLKKAGKKAEMVHWQYGECSKNLFATKQKKPPSTDHNNSTAAPANYLFPGYGGNGYGYPRNYAYNHLECLGTAEDCNGHHTKHGHQTDEQPKDSVKSSLSISRNITSLEEDPIPDEEDLPKCCCLM